MKRANIFSTSQQIKRIKNEEIGPKLDDSMNNARRSSEMGIMINRNETLAAQLTLIGSEMEEEKIDRKNSLESLFSDLSEAQYAKEERIADESLTASYTNKIFKISSINALQDDSLFLELKHKELDDILFRLTLKGNWGRSNLHINDTILVMGTFTLPDLSLEINDLTEQNPSSSWSRSPFTNSIILEPSTHITATHIAAALTCKRKAFFLKNYPLSSAETIYPFVLGSMVHELFQQLLLHYHHQDSLTDNSMIYNQLMEAILKSNLTQIYVLQKKYEEVRKEMISYMDNILVWIKQFFKGVKIEGAQYELVKMVAIEQQLFSNLYGIKGTIDATVQVKRTVNCQGKAYSSVGVCALEIKTGQYESVGNRAQVYFYAILLNQVYMNTQEEHFLVYIKKNKTVPISINQREVASLLQIRNELVKYNQLYHRNEELDFLPPMLRNSRECSFCNYNKFCSLYNLATNNEKNQDLNINGNPDYEEYSKLRDSSDCKTYEYFLKWMRLIRLEQDHSENANHKFRKDILIEENLHLKLINETSEGLNVVFRKRKDVENDLCDGYFVSIESSTNSQITLDRGRIISKKLMKEINFGDLDLQTPRYLEYTVNIQHGHLLKYQKKAKGVDITKELWTIKAHNQGSFSYSLMRYSIYALCSDEKNKKYQRFFIHNIPQSNPSGEESDKNSIKKKFTEELKSLNDIQRNAVITSLTCSDYHLILGIPGSGKTTTIAVLLNLLLKLEKKVLVTSFTNNALDNILIKLKNQGIHFVRVSSNPAAVHEKVRDNVLKQKFESIEEIEELLEKTSIFASTCYGVKHELFQKIKFDYCLIEEASLLVEAASIAPILLADKFIMIGDYFQLNPLITSKRAKEGGMALSLFERLCKTLPDSVTQLEFQYRMNKDIMILSNHLIYSNLIKCGNEATELSKLDFPHPHKSKYSFINELISPDARVIFGNTDTGLCDLRSSTQARMKIENKNKYEGIVIGNIIEMLLKNGLESRDIGIITPYRSQLELLKKCINLKGKGIMVYTIDKSQGIEHKCIILSFVVVEGHRSSLLEDSKRINVAFTRSQSKLLLIGSVKGLSQFEGTNQYLSIIKAQNWITNLPNLKKFQKAVKSDDQNQINHLNSQFKQLNLSD